MNLTTRLLELEGNHGAGMHPFQVSFFRNIARIADMRPSQILFVRMTITVVLATAYMWYTKTPHFPFGIPEVRLLLGARALGGFFGVFCMYCMLVK